MKYLRKALRYCTLYCRLEVMSFKSMLEYRADFIVMMLFTVIMQICNIFVITTIYSNIDFIEQWNYWDILVLYSFLLFSEGFINLFCEGIWRTSGLINSGEIDQFLVRPVPLPLQLITCKIELDGINKILISFLIMSIAFQKNGIAISFLELPIYAYLLICSAVIRSVIIWVASCLSFWSKSSKNSINYMAFAIGEVVQYPIAIYPFFMRAVFCYLIPYAFVSYYPAAFMLKKMNGFHVIGSMTIVMIICLMIAKAVYRLGLRRYESPGN